jgi:hypothetical protein
MYSKIAFASSIRVRQRCRSSNSVCIRPQNASATALSYGSPTVPSEGQQPRAAGAFGEGPRRELGAVVAVNDPARQLAGGAAGVDGHAQRGSSQIGALPGIDGPTDHPARVGIQHHTAVDLAFAGGCSVMSVTHSWFGPSRRKSRLTRSVTVTAAGTRLALRRNGNPARPARRINNATVLRDTTTPWPWTSSARTRGAP